MKSSKEQYRGEAEDDAHHSLLLTVGLKHLGRRIVVDPVLGHTPKHLWINQSCSQSTQQVSTFLCPASLKQGIPACVRQSMPCTLALKAPQSYLRQSKVSHRTNVPERLFK